MRGQLTAWAEGHLALHRVFVYTVLTAIHDDGSHTVQRRWWDWRRAQTNSLVSLSGARELRVLLADFLGVRVGAEHAALVAAAETWRQMPPVIVEEVGQVAEAPPSPPDHSDQQVRHHHLLLPI